MPPLLFVGLAFHVRTNSSAFFVEVLSRTFEVCVVSLDPGETFDIAPLLKEPLETVCLWQLDYLAPIFASRGIRTIVVPMYDGSSTLPDRHWLQMRGCGFINFSIYLHERLSSLGLDSVALRYFPNPFGMTQVDDFSSRRLFFWQRTPSTFLNIEEILRLFGSSVDSIHIHAAADDAWDDVIHIPAGSPPVTLSRWFETQRDYISALECSNIFVAPRLSEGIGQAFLESMGRGMVVVANALPTHTEYIRHSENGILIQEGSSEVLSGFDCSELRHIACNARRSIERGYKEWETQASLIGDLIFAIPVPPRRPRTQIDDRCLIEAYSGGLASYSSYLNALPLP